MVKHIQTIRRLLPTNCLSVFDHFVGLALKGLTSYKSTNYVLLSPFSICRESDFEVHRL